MHRLECMLLRTHMYKQTHVNTRINKHAHKSSFSSWYVARELLLQTGAERLLGRVEGTGDELSLI